MPQKDVRQITTTYSEGTGPQSTESDMAAELPSSLPSYIPNISSNVSIHPNNTASSSNYGFDGIRHDGYSVLGKVHDENEQSSGNTSMSTNSYRNHENQLSAENAMQNQWKLSPQLLFNMPNMNNNLGNPNNASMNATATLLDMAANNPMNQRQNTQQMYPDNKVTDRGASNGSNRVVQPFPTDPTNANNIYRMAKVGISPELVMRPDAGNALAAQFAAGTGGLSMDKTLLARVSGADPSTMGAEEIMQIMRTPDLLSIYQKLQEEDDRRQRRLERNRASARVRREKKKSLVETYEMEVSHLEGILNCLNEHRFGVGMHEDLIHALQKSDGTGEYMQHALMAKEGKMKLMVQMLDQHSQQTNAIRLANAENQMLIASASLKATGIAKSLRQELNLTNEQCQKLEQFTAAAEQEARNLEIITKCFAVLKVHDWLWFPTMENTVQMSRNIMATQQFQKLLKWTARNLDVVKDLPVATVPETKMESSPDQISFDFQENDS